MSRQEFMKELAYLLQDMPEDEKTEALQYYEDYFEDAGGKNEEEIIEELGSPEKVAAMIRYGDDGEHGEYTERGYENSSYRGPVYEVGSRRVRPQNTQTKEEDVTVEYRERPQRRSLLKFLLWGVILVFLSPVILGGGGMLLGAAAIILGLLFGIGVSLAAITLALFISGVVLVPLGIIKVVTIPVLGIFIVSCGLVMIGISLLFLALSFWVYGKLLPGFCRFCMRAVGSVFHRNRRGGAVA